ncbi:MAG: NAD(P)/FAD-dependent oxidoreductase [Verrucomicrobiales bacterium]
MTASQSDAICCDVAVIGGGPAGSTAATILARQGFDVHVFEKERFPRFHIGESLLPYNKPLFEELGVLDQIENAGFMVKHGAQFHIGDGSRCTKFRFRDGSFTDHPTAYQVERSRFDTILLDHAEKCGATVWQETPVMQCAVDAENGVAMTVQTSSGTEERPVNARFLIDASGVANFSGNRAKLREDHPQLRKVAIYGHFEGVKMPSGEEAGDIIIVRMKDAWCWLIPLSEQKISVGLVFDKAALKGSAPAYLFHSAVAQHPALQQRMKAAEVIGQLHAITDFSYTNKAVVSDRLVRIGDAAAFLDPIFSSGVYLAMIGGKAGAEAVADALRTNTALTSKMRRYEKRCLSNMHTYRKMIERFYTPDMMEVLMSPRDFFQVPEAVNAILAGRLDGCWAVHWRLRLFYLLVRVQKARGILPRIPALR